jgi:hypothetical protein
MKMDMDFFIGQNADERRKQEIADAVKTLNGIVARLYDQEVFNQPEFLTELLPAIILNMTENWGYGDVYEDLNTVVIATQKLLNVLAQWEPGEEHPEGLGCKWSDKDAAYEGRRSRDFPIVKRQGGPENEPA